MSQDIAEFVKFKAHVKRIAKKNRDDLKVTVTWDENGYALEIKETADGHVLLLAAGPTIFNVIDVAIGTLPSALEGWGYAYVD